MALPKRVLVGGSYYNGSTLSVSSAVGDYILDMAFAQAGAVNAVSLVPSAYGANDTMKIQHLNTGTTATLATLAEGIPNVGAKAAWKLDYPALEKVLTNEVIRVTYTNTATVALTLYVVLERVR